MSKHQLEQIDKLTINNEILQYDLDVRVKLISKFRWFCLKLSVDLSENEAELTKEVALILLNEIDDNTKYVSFDEFIKDQ